MLQECGQYRQCGARTEHAQYYSNFDDSIFSYDRTDHAFFQNSKVVSLQQFTKSERKNQHEFCGIVMSDELHHSLNYTQCATLGGGDDQDGDRSGLEQLAENELSHLKIQYADVSKDPQHPIDRSNAVIQFEYQILLKDGNSKPPKRKIYLLDTRELEELNKQLKLFFDIGQIEPAYGLQGADPLHKKEGWRSTYVHRLSDAEFLDKGGYFPSSSDR